MLELHTLAMAVLVALAGFVAAQSGQWDDLLDDLAGTWSTGSGAVRTGPVSRPQQSLAMSPRVHA
jgi:hypothetical protein